MSSEYYDVAAELERARQAELKKELEDELRKLESKDSQIYASVQNQIAASYAADHLQEQHEYIENSASGADSLKSVEVSYFSGGNVLEELDFSSILEDRGEHKFEQQFKEIIARISERKVRTSADVADRKRLISAINEYLRDDEYDIEQKMFAIKYRIEIYLAARATETGDSVVAATQARYKALCEWLEIPAQNISDNMLPNEIARLEGVAYKRKEKNYIQDSITEIMEEMGLSLDNSSILDGMEGDLYSNESSACDVFVSADGQGIMLETVAKNGYTRSAVERDIHKTCALQAQLVEKARERGIILNLVQQSVPTYEEVVKENEIMKTDKKKEKTRRRSAEKVQYMRGE